MLFAHFARVVNSPGVTRSPSTACPGGVRGGGTLPKSLPPKRRRMERSGVGCLQLVIFALCAVRAYGEGDIVTGGNAQLNVNLDYTVETRSIGGGLAYGEALSATITPAQLEAMGITSEDIYDAIEAANGGPITNWDIFETNELFGIAHSLGWREISQVNQGHILADWQEEFLDDRGVIEATEWAHAILTPTNLPTGYGFDPTISKVSSGVQLNPSVLSDDALGTLQDVSIGDLAPDVSHTRGGLLDVGISSIGFGSLFADVADTPITGLNAWVTEFNQPSLRDSNTTQSALWRFWNSVLDGLTYFFSHLDSIFLIVRGLIMISVVIWVQLCFWRFIIKFAHIIFDAVMAAFSKGDIDNEPMRGDA